MGKKLIDNKLFCNRYRKIYDFTKFKTIRTLGGYIINSVMTMDMAKMNKIHQR